jgi:hypothetical protein
MGTPGRQKRCFVAWPEGHHEPASDTQGLGGGLWRRRRRTGRVQAPDGALQSGGAAEQAKDGLANASTSPVATLIRCSRPGCWPARPTPPTVLPQRRLFAVGGSGPSP